MKIKAMLLAVSVALALPRPGTCFSPVLIAAGVGSAGDWQTSIEVANPADSAIEVGVSEFSSTCPLGGDFGCNVVVVLVPAHGTVQIPVTGGIINTDDNPHVKALGPGHLFTVYLAASDGIHPFGPTPLVARIRAINQTTGGETEYPVTSLETLFHRANPTELAFPGVQGGGVEHCNLILTSFRALDDGVVPITAQLDLYSSEGNLLGSKTVVASDCAFSDGGGCANMFLVDVAHQLGAGTVTGGQLHVRQISGGDAIWGELACSSARDGHFSVVPGAHP
jgi:hypothetical protein